MPIRSTYRTYDIRDFLRANVQHSTTLRRLKQKRVKMSVPFELRSISIEDLASSSLLTAHRHSGWISFLHSGPKLIGIAEVSHTEHAIVYAGVTTGAVARAAAAALRKAEKLAGDRRARVFFIRSSAIFFNALVMELPSTRERRLIPISHTGKPDELQESMAQLAQRRLAAARQTVSRRSAPS